MADWLPPVPLIAHFGLIFVIFNLLVLSAAFMVWMERKVCAYIQDRVGPNRVGAAGWLQPFADVIKLLTKEELRPKAADALLFAIAPVISAGAAFAAFSVVPFGAETTLFGLLDEPLPLQVTDVNVGVLVLFAIASMGVYGIVLAGWSSNSKYSLLGGLRSSAQMISYELAMGMAVIGVVLLGSSLNLTDIVNAQRTVPFAILQPLGFLIYFVCMFADTNRLPFDLPEAETELVAGYHTEYSSIKYALFYMAEYINMVTVSALAVVLFFGGWHGPFAPGVWWFGLKMAFFIWLFMWVRATLPRFRYDQLMKLGWKLLLPLGILNVLLTAFAVAVWPR
jgi:NADH-quinone oxidoreductase subunit H